MQLMPRQKQTQKLISGALARIQNMSETGAAKDHKALTALGPLLREVDIQNLEGRGWDAIKDKATEALQRAKQDPGAKRIRDLSFELLKEARFQLDGSYAVQCRQEFRDQKAADQDRRLRSHLPESIRLLEKEFQRQVRGYRRATDKDLRRRTERAEAWTGIGAAILMIPATIVLGIAVGTTGPLALPAATAALGAASLGASRWCTRRLQTTLNPNEWGPAGTLHDIRLEAAQHPHLANVPDGPGTGNPVMDAVRAGIQMGQKYRKGTAGPNLEVRREAERSTTIKPSLAPRSESRSL